MPPKETTTQNKKPKKSKDEIYLQIVNAVLKLEVEKGHLRWSLSDLSRVAKVSRTLIYYYFGKSKEEILNVAIDLIGVELFGLNRDLRDSDFLQAVKKSRRAFVQHPYIPLFYLKWSGSQTLAGEHLKSLEEKYIASLKQLFPGTNEEVLWAMFSLFFGLAATPHLEEKSIDYAIRAMLQLMPKMQI